MATEAEIREPVVETFKEEKDREMLTEASSVAVQKSEGIAEPLPKFEVQLTKGAIEVNARSTEGEFIYESSPAAKVADEQILSPLELNEPAVVLNEMGSTFSESSVEKETENNHVEIISTIKENSTVEIKDISKETLNGYDNELNGKILPDDKANLSEAYSSQIAEGKFFEPDLTEEMSVLEPESSKEDVGEATISKEGLGHTISEESENVNTVPEEMKSRGDMEDEDANKETILCDATEKANMKSENPIDHNEEATEICENGNRNLNISSTVTPVEETCVSNAGSDDTYSEAIGSSDALENEHIVETEASTHEQLSSSTIAPENIMHKTEAKPNTEVDLASTEALTGEYRDEKSSTVTDEVQTEVEAIRSNDARESLHIVEEGASLDESLSLSTIAPENFMLEAEANTEVDLASKEATTGGYRDEESSTVADVVQTKVEVLRTFKDDETFLGSETIQMNPEEPSYAAPNKINVSESCQNTETTTTNANLPEAAKEALEDETPEADYSQEKQTLERKDITIDDLKEEDDDIQSNTVQVLQSTDPLVEETKQEQVFEENQVPILEASHVHDAHEPNSIPECSTLVQTLAEGEWESDTGLTSTSEIDADKLETESKSNYTEKLQISAEKNTEDRLQQHGEDSEEQMHETLDAIENTTRESETTLDASSVTISEEAGLKKEESSTPKLRFKSLNEMQDESTSAAKDKECEAEETSEEQPEQNVHDIPSTDSQTTEKEESVEFGAEKTFTDDYTLSLQSSKKDVDNLGNSLQIAEEIQPVNVGKEYTEASQVESEKIEKILEPATQVHYSEVSHEIEESGVKGQSLEAATPESGVEKILNEGPNEANETTENYISSEKNISTVDLNEDKDGDISCNSAEDLHSTLSLVEETNQEQVFEENQVLIEEPKHDAHEANSIPESSTFGQTWTEEASEMELTSTRQTDAYDIETKSKLQIDAENSTGEKLQQAGETFEEHDRDTHNAVENTIHESETNVDPSSVASSEKACSHKEESNTPELRFKSFEEIQDESGIEANEKENKAEETSEVQLERSVPEIQVSESQSVGNDKSVESGAEKTFIDEQSLFSESSKKDVEASHAESEKLEKILDRATRVHYSDYEAEEIGIKEESLEVEAATTEIGVEKLLNEEKNEAKGTSESYISSEKNITTLDPNVEEDGDIPCYTPKDLRSTILLVEETKQEQVCEENEGHIEELKHGHDVHEAISIPENNTIKQTLAEGESDMDLTSTSQVDAVNLEAEFKLSSTEKLQSHAENNTENQLQQHGEASEEQDHETPNAVDNNIHENATTFNASSEPISEEVRFEGASLQKEESSTYELRFKSLEEMEDGNGNEAKEKEYVADETSKVQPPQDVHETQFSDSPSGGNDRSVETEAEKTLTDDKCLSSESSKNVDDLAISHPTEKEILPEEVGKENDEAPHMESENVKIVECVTQLHYSEVSSELKESEMKEESLEAATIEKEISQEELPSTTTHVISETAKSDNQCEVSRDQESEVSKNIHKQSTDEDGLVEGLHEGSTAETMLNRSLGEEETEREYTDEAPKELTPERDFDGLDCGDIKTEVKCSKEEVLSSEVVSLQPDKDIGVNDQEYPIEEKSQAHNPNISDSSVVDSPGAEILENAFSEADHEGLLHKSTKESEISEISSTAVETNKEVAITAGDNALESLVDHEKPETKPVEAACEEKEATEKSLPTETDEDKELETDEAKKEEEEREVQKGAYSASEVTPVVGRDPGDVTTDKIITEVEIKEDNSNVVPDEKNPEQGDPKESTETAMSSEDKHIQSDSVTGTVGLEIDEPIPLDSSEAAGSNINEGAKEYIEDQTIDSFKIAQSNKNEEAKENNEDQATEIFEAARSHNDEEVKEHKEDQATLVATDSEIKRDEFDCQSSITDGEGPKIHDRDIKLENSSSPDQSNTDMSQIDEHLDLATLTEIAPDPVELQNTSPATKEIGTLEEPQTIKSTEVTTASVGKDVELLQQDPATTIIQDEIQKPKTENDHNSTSELAIVESKAKEASDEFKEMEQESSIKQATDSEPDLTQGSINTTLSVAEDRETLDQLPEDYVSEHANDHVDPVQEDSSESKEPVISSEEKDTLLVQPVSVTGTVTREIEELMHANASETEAEAERVVCGEEKGTIHDYQIPESSQSLDSTESAPSDLLQGSADETNQKVEDIVSETLPPADLLPSPDQIELEADPKLTIDLENSKSNKDVPQMEEEATTDIVQARGEISRCAAQSFEESKSEEEQRTKDEMNEAKVKSLPTDATNTAPSEEETPEIIEHPIERREQIAKNEELPKENAESDEDRELKSDEVKDEEEEGKVQREENSCSEVPLVAERDLFDGTINKIIAEVETKEDSSSVVLDRKISEQVDTEESIETVISSEDKHIQSDSGAGTIGLEIDETKRADSFEAAGSNKSEEAKENYKGQATDSSDVVGSNENEEPKENKEDQETVEARGSETKQTEDDTQSNLTEGDDLKIHVPDVKLENLSPPEQLSTNICEIDEPLVLAKPTEISPDTELDKISVSSKEMGIPEEPPSSECTEVTIASRDKDVQLLQKDETKKLETGNVSNAASEAATVEAEAKATTDESKEIEQESTFTKTTNSSESDLVQGSENRNLPVAEEKETLDQLVEDNVYNGVQDLNAGKIQKEEQVNLSSDESIRAEITDSRSFEVPGNKIQAQKDQEESSEPGICSGDEDTPRLQPISVATKEAKGDEVPKIADEISEEMGKSPKTKIADTLATSEEEMFVIPEIAERSEYKEVKTDEEGELQRDKDSGSEVPVLFENNPVDLTSNKIITGEMKEDNSIVIPEKKISMPGEPEENTETLISREVPFLLTRAVNLENEELKHVNASEAAAETTSLECEEDNSKFMEPSKNSPYENLHASAKVTPAEAEAVESEDPESLHVPPHSSKSSSIENSTKDGGNDNNPEAAPLLASEEHIVVEADQKVAPEPENFEGDAQVQQEATSESYQESPEPATSKDETKEATEKYLPTESANSIATLSEKADHFNEGIKVVPEKEELHVKIAERDEEDETMKTDEKEESENSGSEAPVIVEASRDIETKVSPKKSNNILSGVGSKVKHSIAKVKKAITGKHSHSKESKPPSPK